MKTKVKICGLQSVEVLKSFIKFPIDYAGFVFAPSRRRVQPSKAQEIISQLPSYTLAVGVFVNPSLEELEEVLTAAPLQVIQLHGAETPEFCKEVKERFEVQVWKALSAKGDAEPVDLLTPYIPYVDGFLLDTYDPRASGGTGIPFPWECIPAYQKVLSSANIPLFIAGGLNGDNVTDLLDQYFPYGVDVSSGVETDGVKDPEKIERFVERVQRNGYSTRP
jgi:phosphoribosylanthranilate isomerase